MDNKELEGLLLYAGVGIFILFALFSLLAVWSNGIFWSWITVKYLFLMGAAALTLMLEDSARRRYAIAFAAFIGLMFYGDQLTYHGKQISVLASADLEDLQEDAKEHEEKLSKKDDRLEVDEMDNKLKYYGRFSKDDMEAESDWDKLKEKKEKLEKERDEKRKKVKENTKVDVGDIEKMAGYAWDIEREQEEVAEKQTDLTWAKGHDAFILLGAFFMLAGALIGGAPESEGSYYSSSYGASSYTPIGTGQTSYGAGAAAAAPAAPAPAADKKPEAKKPADAKPAADAGGDKPAEGGEDKKEG